MFYDFFFQNVNFCWIKIEFLDFSLTLMSYVFPWPFNDKGQPCQNLKFAATGCSIQTCNHSSVIWATKHSSNSFINGGKLLNFSRRLHKGNLAAMSQNTITPTVKVSSDCSCSKKGKKKDCWQTSTGKGNSQGGENSLEEENSMVQENSSSSREKSTP